MHNILTKFKKDISAGKILSLEFELNHFRAKLKFIRNVSQLQLFVSLDQEFTVNKVLHVNTLN